MSKKMFALTSPRSTLRATRPTKVTNPITSLPLRHHAPSTSRTSANQGTGELSPLVAFAATHSAEATLAQLGSSPRGLAADLVQASRELHGPNVIVTSRPDPLVRRLARVFVSPFTLILAALAVISLYTDVIAAQPGAQGPSTALVIAAMVAISGILTFTQEGKGASAAASLRHLVTTTCCVVRAGVGERELPMAEVVPGDIVRLAAGDLVPADVRILAAKDLFVNQAPLTGESEPVEKLAVSARDHGENPGRLALTDCDTVAFSGTTVQSGSATAVVMATGADTCIGTLARTLDDGPAATAFDEGLAQVSRVLVGFMLVMCPIVLVVNGLTKGNWLDALLFAISVAVGITPQMLPVIVATCLARGAQEMSREDVIVKDLGAMQNLGAMDVLCCDKTGTLTEDRVILERHMDVMGREDARVLCHAYLNSRFQTSLRNLIDQAIIDRMGEVADEAGDTHQDTGMPDRSLAPSELDRRYTKVDEVPFDFEHRRMSIVVADETGKTQMVTKGAVAEVLEACSAVELDGAVRPLTDGIRGRVLAKVRELGDAGMRVSALPAHDGAAAPVPGACLHRLVRRTSVGQRGRGPPRAPPQVGRGLDCLLHAVAGADELGLRHPHVRGDVLRGVPGAAEALGLVALPSGFFGLLALLMAGYLALSAAAKALYVRRHGNLL